MMYLKMVEQTTDLIPMMENYELYYPCHSKNKTIVFYYSERQRYGKYGS